MDWTDEQVEGLKKLWADGLSANQIAGELVGFSRNAVLGKVHRLKLPSREKAPSSAAPPPRKPRSDKVRFKKGFNAKPAQAIPDRLAPDVVPRPRVHYGKSTRVSEKFRREHGKVERDEFDIRTGKGSAFPAPTDDVPADVIRDLERLYHERL